MKTIKTNDNKKTSIKDITQKVSAGIIECMEQGVIPWESGFTSKFGLPKSYDGKTYQGMNRWILTAEMILKGYESNQWITFNKCKKEGGNVIKGQKGTQITFWKFLQVERVNKDGEVKEKSIPLLKTFTVFNLCQTSLYDSKKHSVEATIPAEVNIGMAEQIVAKWDDIVNIRYGYDNVSSPYYSPSRDFINIPYYHDGDSGWVTEERMHKVTFHEMVHSTGHKSRLDRFDKAILDNIDAGMLHSRGQYSAEELVAEMGSEILSQMCDFKNSSIEDTSSYIQSWLKCLKNDPQWIMWASSRAEKAVNYILDNIEDAGDEESPVLAKKNSGFTFDMGLELTDAECDLVLKNEHIRWAEICIQDGCGGVIEVLNADKFRKFLNDEIGNSMYKDLDNFKSILSKLDNMMYGEKVNKPVYIQDYYTLDTSTAKGTSNRMLFRFEMSDGAVFSAFYCNDTYFHVKQLTTAPTKTTHRLWDSYVTTSDIDTLMDAIWCMANKKLDIRKYENISKYVTKHAITKAQKLSDDVFYKANSGFGNKPDTVQPYKFLVTNGPSIHLTHASDTGNSWVFNTLEDAKQFMLDRWGVCEGARQYNYMGDEFVENIRNLTFMDVAKNTDIYSQIEFALKDIADAKKMLKIRQNRLEEWEFISKHIKGLKKDVLREDDRDVLKRIIEKAEYIWTDDNENGDVRCCLFGEDCRETESAIASANDIDIKKIRNLKGKGSIIEYFIDDECLHITIANKVFYKLATKHDMLKADNLCKKVSGFNHSKHHDLDLFDVDLTECNNCVHLFDNEHEDGYWVHKNNDESFWLCNWCYGDSSLHKKNSGFKEMSKLKKLEIIVSQRQKHYDENEPGDWGYYNAYRFVLKEINNLLKEENDNSNLHKENSGFDIDDRIAIRETKFTALDFELDESFSDEDNLVFEITRWSKGENNVLDFSIHINESEFNKMKEFVDNVKKRNKQCRK